MLACSHRSARIPARPLVKARSHVALQPGAAADDMSELFSGSFPVPPFVSALLRGLLRRPAPAKPLLCLRPRSGSGSPVPVPPEKPLLVLGAAPTRFRVPETDGQNRRNECTSTELLSSVSSAAMPKRRSATRRTSQCFRSQPKRRGRTTLGRGNPGPNGIDASLSADWLNSPAASLKVLTSPSRASCAATNTSGRSLLAIRGRLSRSESAKSASTPSSNSTAPPSGNQPATATRRCPAKGHFLTRYRKVYPHPSRSEDGLKRELQDARIVRRGNPAELRRGCVGAWLPEIYVVEYVKEFGSKLDREALHDTGALDHAQISIEESRSSQVVPSRTPKTSDSIGREFRRVEKPGDHVSV